LKQNYKDCFLKDSDEVKGIMDEWRGYFSDTANDNAFLFALSQGPIIDELTKSNTINLALKELIIFLLPPYSPLPKI